MYRIIDTHSTEPEVVWQDPQKLDEFENLMEWEDILDDYGEPEPTKIPGVWLIDSLPPTLIIRIPRS